MIHTIILVIEDSEVHTKSYDSETGIRYVQGIISAWHNMMRDRLRDACLGNREDTNIKYAIIDFGKNTSSVYEIIIEISETFVTNTY